MIGIIDYGVSNLKSVENALKFLEKPSKIISSGAELENCDIEKLILPGVGAFGDGMELLKEKKLDVAIKKYIEKDKMILGICLGMQFLFEKSFEKGEHMGLCVIKGEVVPIPVISGGGKIPHMGWNSLNLTNETKLFDDMKDDKHVYFVHSYYAKTDEKYITSTTDYNGVLTASVQNKNVHGTQFHPEKSGEVGLNILKNFINL